MSAGERYVALGLATTRSAWFTDVARWSTVGSIPVEFVKCISAEELRTRLGSGRAFSVVLIDAATGAVDRDLLDLAGSHKVPVVVVDDGRTDRDWLAIGVRAVLSGPFDRQRLLDTLGHASTMIGGATALPLADSANEVDDDAPTVLVTVTGGGGTGCSTVAIALAQGLSASPQGDVVLADLSLDADQAMLHDARDIIPGIQELVEAHRSGRPTPAEVRALTFAVEGRGYRLLLGVRRHRDWTALRPRSFDAAIAGLQRAFGTVVIDADPDLEGEAETGSVEIEERNLMARTAVGRADVVLVVGGPGVKGVHTLVRIVNDIRSSGVTPDRILAVVNGAPRSPRARAELVRSFADLTGATAGLPPVIGPVFLTERRSLDQVHRDGTRLPAAMTRPLAGAVRSVLDRAARSPVAVAAPQAIRPGTLGSWADQEAAGQ